MAAVNPFDGNNIAGAPYADRVNPAPFVITNDPTGAGRPDIDLQGKLGQLRQALEAKYAQTAQMGAYQGVILSNLQIIRNRVARLAELITELNNRIQAVRYDLESRMDQTLNHIIEDLTQIQAVQAEAIVGEIAAIQHELNQIPANADLAEFTAPNQPLHPAEFNIVPAAAPPVILPAAPQPDTPPGFIVGGKKKKGGYTYPKMRSRSRLRSHPRITHKFNTIKPKKKSRRHRKHKKSAKKHRKH